MKEDMIKKIAQALRDAAPSGSRVILFGSHARGLARPDSDFDFLVVEPEVRNRLEEIFRLRKIVGDTLGETLQPVDVIVTDEERFRLNADVPNTLAYEGVKHGRVYA